MFLTIVVFAAILIILIMVHEFGHFIVAKLNKVKVEEFAFGFPPRIFSKIKNGTRYSFNAIPLGGYVTLLGENEDLKTPGSYFSKKIWQKILIVGTGVVMNFILAILIITIGFSIGMPPLVSDPATLSGKKIDQVMVIETVPDSPAAKINLQNGTIIDGFTNPNDLQQFTQSHKGQTVTFQTEKNGKKENLTVTLSTGDAPLGVSVIPITIVKQPVYKAFVTAILEVGKSIGAVFIALYMIIKSLFSTGTAGAAGGGVVGPVGIFNFTSAAISIGWIYILQLLAILSINLGIINILPFPALDGGKILFLALEGFFRRKVVRLEVENIIHTIGFIILIIFILAITFRDIWGLR